LKNYTSKCFIKLTPAIQKPTDTGLLLHFDGHVDHRYKKGLVKTMINRAYNVSSTWKTFIDECESLKLTFANLRYPSKLMDATINKFISSHVTKEIDATDERSDNLPKVLFSLPLTDQKTTDSTRKQLQSLSYKI